MVPSRLANVESIISRARPPKTDGPSEGAARSGGIRPRGLHGVLPELVGAESGDGHLFDLQGAPGPVRTGAPRRPPRPEEGRRRRRRPPAPPAAQRPHGGGPPARGLRSQRSPRDG